MTESTQTRKKSRPQIVGFRKDVAAKLQQRIDVGKGFLVKPIIDENDFFDLRTAAKNWRTYNYEFLEQVFADESLATELRIVAPAYYANLPLGTRVTDFLEGVKKDVGVLESISERLELYSEVNPVDGGTNTPTSDRPKGSAIFIVHGHDEAAKAEMSSLLIKLGLDPIVLAEQADQGRTIIEKLEHYASQAGFAIVLLTADDVGRAKNAKQDKARARQNVVLELGYFIALLGRDRVCALHKPDVELPDMELPSDFSGVVYKPMDGHGAWRYSLAKELKAAGYEVDLNKL